MEQKQLKQLLLELSLEEKAGQLVQLMGNFYETDVESVLTGPGKNLGLTEENIHLAGSILGTYGAETLKKIQSAYMKQHPHHIPLLFMMDVIHGMKTIFPMPLAQAASFEPEMTEKCASAAAKEAAASGLHVTFSPMADLVRDARWGRVMESCGEDPYVIGKFTQAQVKGFQGEDMGAPGKICACVKHFAGYGAPVAGREYNTVELCEHTFRDFYMKGYEAGIEAGAGMVMTSFNTLNGIPATVNQKLMRTILRGELGFDGVLISDFAAIQETIAHGYSENEEKAAQNALECGVDIDMMTGVYAGKLTELVKKGVISEALLDESVWRVLKLKNRLGLFENPYKDADAEAEAQLLLCQAHRELAREAAAKSFVLLKNDGILPVCPEKAQKVAFIGPYVNRKEMISSWAITGDTDPCVTIREAAEELFDKAGTAYLEGSPILDRGYAARAFRGRVEKEYTEEEENALLQEAVAAAKAADIVILPLGEHFMQSGEAASRAMLDLPEVQMRLLRAVSEVNENIVTVLFNGRPLDLREVSSRSKAVLEVWFPGTEGGHAILDVLTGRKEPAGRLPISFPYCVGQVPISYNAYATGRPDDPDVGDKFKSRYLDIPNTPLYPFGYGMGYTGFEVSPVRLDADKIAENGKIKAAVTLKNIGERIGTETLQFYIQDISASVVRPVKELKGFLKVTLAPGEEREISFEIKESMLRFLRADGTVGSEPGTFRVWIAKDSTQGEPAEFILI
ncbi:MAG: glycoside hydrolase family 3 N-terminal domain-containing protein [Lachnospiraceae bacterium]